LSQLMLRNVTLWIDHGVLRAMYMVLHAKRNVDLRTLQRRMYRQICAQIAFLRAEQVYRDSSKRGSADVKVEV